MKNKEIFEFSEFKLDPRTRTLKRQGEAVTLNRRAFDVLLYLIQNPGRVVSREEIVKNVWPETFVDDNSVAQSISALRRALEEKPGDNNYVVTVPGRGYQFISEVKSTELELAVIEPEASVGGAAAGAIILERETIRTSITHQANELPSLPAPRSSRTELAIAILLLAVLAGGGYLFHMRSARRLTAKDTVVVADFANTTGDPVFDDTLRRGLSTELEQSPFLNLLSDQRISHTLALMTQPRDARLTAELAREVCQRTASSAVLNGTIAQIGTRYLLTLKAVNCSTGETLASAEAQASDKNQVLDALGAIGADIRRKLGESLATMEKYDVTLREATTPSLEALKAHTVGEKFLYQGNPMEALPYFERAVQLDPNFAMAYMQLGIAGMSVGEPGRARESFAKAFSLREHTSEREKLQIDSAYYGSVTGELDKAIQSLHEVIEIYKHTPAYHGLIIYYSKTGQYEESAEAARILLAHDADRNFAFYHLAMDELALQNLNEARKVVKQGQEGGADNSLHGCLYLLAFLQSDPAAMAEQQKWFAGHGDEIYGFELAAETEAYAGNLAKARELTRSAFDAAMQDKNMESAATGAANGALREAAYGDMTEARREAAEAVKLAPGDPNVMTQAALAFAMSGETAQAEGLAQELNKRFPLNTQVQLLSIPAIQAQLQLAGGQADAALNTLRGGLSIEYADTGPGGVNTSCLYATYIRGEVYLAAGRGAEAAGEFDKIIDHSGIVGNCLTGALAHLGVARASALQTKYAEARVGTAAPGRPGERSSPATDANDEPSTNRDAARARALAAYKEFLTLWKDADSEIPILKQAKAEYAKLR